MMRLPSLVGLILRVSIPLCRIHTTAAADLPVPGSLSGSSALGYSWNVKAQNESLCDAGGKQWTGTVKVTPERTLFFWFFESRRDASTDPVVLWLSGGPAASSMLGLFAEVGPCSTDGKTTKRLATSWSNEANLLFVDQPAGTGFSTVSRSSATPVTLAAAGQDMNILLHAFYTSIFPSLSKRPLHFVGESFGGRYVPAYTKHIVQKQAAKAADAAPMNIESIVLVSAAVDFAHTALGEIDHFCSDRKGNGFGAGFDAATCSSMKRGASECEKQGQACRDTMNLNTCRNARSTCDSGIGKYFSNGVRPGGRNPYDDRTTCTTPPACRAKSFDQLVQYCNLPSVQAQLGFRNVNFQGINFQLNSQWTAAGDPLMPSTRDLTFVLDKTTTRMMVLNGNNDVSVNTPGQIRAFDALPWKDQAKYKQQEFKPWYFKDSSGKSKQAGLSKGVEKLLFVSVDNAGHEVPGATGQPEASLEVLNRWMKKEKLLAS